MRCKAPEPRRFLFYTDPELSRSLGKSLGEFKKGKEDLEREVRDIKDEAFGQGNTLELNASIEEDKEESK